MEPLTAAALATLLITKLVEKLGESLGEKIPDLGSKVWEQVANLKGVMKAKSPETVAVAYLHNFGTQLHQLRHPLSRRGKNSIDGQVKFIMRSVDRS
jgi:hypothetical protein